ncbi:MAG: M28 family peptidase [Candidatus Saccharicenans sp.]|nr:M28 family peptidase [Candidatus Saccharicenans sp.]
MKEKRGQLIFLASLLFFSLSTFSPRLPWTLRLVQVPKQQPWLEYFLQQESIECLQELEQSYLLRLGRDEIIKLRNKGFVFRTIAFYRYDRFYALVRAIGPEDLDFLQRSFQPVFLEGDDYLLILREVSELEEIPVSVKRRLLPQRGRTLAAHACLPQEYTWLFFKEDAYEQLVSEVSAESLRNKVTDLQNFNTRYALTDNCLQAAQYLYNYFLSLGLPVNFHDFTYSGYLCRNVISEIRGQTYPEQVVIICAHYDSTSNQRWTLAPGADDNGSGTAAVMEAARLLISRPLDFTVRFILFSAEEQGLVGSLRYVQEKLNPAENIIAVINLDMIAYADLLPEDLDIIGDRSSGWLVEKISALTSVYGPLPPKKIIDPSFVYSDHASFWDRGIPAVCLIEDASVPNPYYHKTTDTVDTLDFEFYRQAVRSSLSGLAVLAQLIKPGWPGTPAEFNFRTGTYASIFNHLKAVELFWREVPGAAGYNVYRSSSAYLGFEKINQSPVAATRFIDVLLGSEAVFYYAVTAVDSLGRESNFSRVIPVNAGTRSSAALSGFLSGFFNLSRN